jgi:hypothetical protein
MAKKSEIVNRGLSSINDEELIIDIRTDGIVSTPWLTCEGNEILKSVGKTPERFERISNYCG